MIDGLKPMIDGLKRWFPGSSGAAAPGAGTIAAWARQHQYACRAVQDEGFVVEGRAADTPWRLEWGPAQRAYVAGQELRLRAELGLPHALQLVLMNRRLQTAMETEVFEQYVEGVQTRIDEQTPPEMRWLVMFPKLSGVEMGLLREHYVAVSSGKLWLTTWLQGPLTAALAALQHDPAVPLVLMIGRGRLLLRTALAEPEPHALQAWLRLFVTAIEAARRVGAGREDPPPSTHQPSTWAASAMPGDEPRS